jgi:hypothetical protein
MAELHDLAKPINSAGIPVVVEELVQIKQYRELEKWYGPKGYDDVASIIMARAPPIPARAERDPIVHVKTFTAYRPNSYLITGASKLEEDILLYGYLVGRDLGWKHILLSEFLIGGVQIHEFQPARLSTIPTQPEFSLPPNAAAKELLLYYKSNAWKPLRGIRYKRGWNAMPPEV